MRRTGLLAKKEKTWTDVQEEKQVDVVCPVPPFCLLLSLWPASRWALAPFLCPWLILRMTKVMKALWANTRCQAVF